MSGLHVSVTGSGPRALLVHGSMSFGALAFSEQRPLRAEFELHVADRRGNDVDQPRNLAKAVTVE